MERGQHYARREEGVVEIESRWMARRREQLGVNPVVRRRDGQLKPRPLAQNARRAGDPLLCVVKAGPAPDMVSRPTIVLHREVPSSTVCSQRGPNYFHA